MSQLQLYCPQYHLERHNVWDLTGIYRESPSYLCQEPLFALCFHTHLTNLFGSNIFALCRDSLAKQRLPCSHAFYKNQELETGKY